LAGYYRPVKVFDYSIALPRDLKINAIYKSQEFGWEVIFGNNNKEQA